MNKDLLRPEIQEFIRKNLNTDLSSLILKGSPFPDMHIREIAQQIEARKKAEKKLPTWFNTQGIIYPASLSIEQTSSELTAVYKASLFQGDHMVDITGGLGVDDYYFSKQFQQVDHCEINTGLSAVAAHNFGQLSARNIRCFPEDGVKHLAALEKTDLIYADPARRDDIRRKVFLLSDCTPDITEHQEFLLNKAPVLLIKTSPMLDIKAGLDQLDQVSEIHIVAVKNEVKELLWVLRRQDVREDVRVITVNLDDRRETPEYFSFTMDEATNAVGKTGEISSYLYEPNSALMKSGAFNLIADKYQIEKLHMNTHLYTNSSLIEFPGRSFEVIKVIDYNKKEVKAQLGGKKANVSTRNFPETVASLRKKFRIKDGGEQYVFFCTGKDDRRLVVFGKKV